MAFLLVHLDLSKCLTNFNAVDTNRNSHSRGRFTCTIQAYYRKKTGEFKDYRAKTGQIASIT